jgi:pimeloyl-ACP methyl ester carboxylesterase
MRTGIPFDISREKGVVMKTVRTELLEIAFDEGGPADGAAVLLLHGWPDAPCGWEFIASRLQAQGWRTVTPYLRGSGATRFLSEETPRVGAAVALAQDAVDLANVLGMDRFAVIGHDWGARVAYTLAALFPARITAVAGLALAYQPCGVFRVPSFEQSRRFWYQWLMCVDDGAQKVRADPVGFAHIQWETWSPEGWFDEGEFARTAESFLNPDWVSITLNAYRSRWLAGEAWDARYDAAQRRLGEAEVLWTPTLMIQGAADRCDAASESEGLERYFAGPYRRLLLGGVGHFPHREAPRAVADAILHHLQRKESR